jgi:hypothetical protein
MDAVARGVRTAAARRDRFETRSFLTMVLIAPAVILTVVFLGSPLLLAV